MGTLRDLYENKKIFVEDYDNPQNTPAYRKDIEDDKIVELRDAGYSLRKIAEELNCSPSTVKNRIDAILVEKQTRYQERKQIWIYLDHGYSMRKIAHELGCSPNTAKKKMAEAMQYVRDEPEYRRGVLEAYIRKYPTWKTCIPWFKQDLTDEEYALLFEGDAEYYDYIRNQDAQKEKGNAYKSDIDIGEVMRLKDRGWSLRKIAKHFGCSPHTIKRRLEDARFKY